MEIHLSCRRQSWSREPRAREHRAACGRVVSASAARDRGALLSVTARACGVLWEYTGRAELSFTIGACSSRFSSTLPRTPERNHIDCRLGRRSPCPPPTRTTATPQRAPSSSRPSACSNLPTSQLSTFAVHSPYCMARQRMKRHCCADCLQVRDLPHVQRRRAEQAGPEPVRRDRSSIRAGRSDALDPRTSHRTVQHRRTRPTDVACVACDVACAC